MFENNILCVKVFILCFIFSEITQSVTLETIETLAFNDLLNLSEM